MRVLTILGLSGCPEKLGRVFPVIPVVRIIAGLRSWCFVFLFPTTGYLTRESKSTSCIRRTSFFVRPSPLRKQAFDGQDYEAGASFSFSLPQVILRQRQARPAFAGLFFARPSPLRERALDGRVPYEKSATSWLRFYFLS